MRVKASGRSGCVREAITYPGRTSVVPVALVTVIVEARTVFVENVSALNHIAFTELTCRELILAIGAVIVETVKEDVPSCFVTIESVAEILEALILLFAAMVETVKEDVPSCFVVTESVAEILEALILLLVAIVETVKEDISSCGTVICDVASREDVVTLEVFSVGIVTEFKEPVGPYDNKL